MQTTSTSADVRPTRARGGRLIGAIAAMAVAAGTMLVATTGPAAAIDNRPCSRPQVSRANHWVQYCPMWRGSVPVYSSPDQGNAATVLGYLNRASGNWFVGDLNRSTYRSGSLVNTWWAYTMADNGRWGWVPEVFFSGGLNNEPDAGLYVCGAGPNVNRCAP